jgi:hypothetical protein
VLGDRSGDAAEHHGPSPAPRPRAHYEQIELIGHANDRLGGVTEHDVGAGVEVLREGG